MFRCKIGSILDNDRTVRIRKKVYTDPVYINKIYEARIRHGYIRRAHNPAIGLEYIYPILVIINTRIN